MNAADQMASITDHRPAPGIRRLIVRAESLLQIGGGLFLATLAVHGLNYVFHVVMSRALGPADYGALVVLISLVSVLAIPMNTIQTTIALRTSGSTPETLRTMVSGARELMRGPWLAAGVAAWVGVALLSRWIAAMLRLPTFLPVIIVGAFLAIAVLLPAVRGVLQGSHAFGPLGVSLLIEAGGKVLVSLALVGLGLGLIGATGGIILGALAALVFGLRLLPRSSVPRTAVSALPQTVELIRAGAPVGATLIAFTILTNADLIAVKMLFAPQEAGYYAAASTAGKVIIYLAWPIWAVLFPVLGGAGNVSRATRRGLGLGIGLTILAAAPILGLYTVAPRAVAGFLFGSQFLQGARLFLPLGAAMLAYQVAFLAMSHEIAVGRQRFLRMAGFCAVALVALLTVIPRTLGNVASTTLLVGWATAALMSWSSLNEKTDSWEEAGG